MVMRRSTPTENKLAVLYTLENLGACTSEQLLHFMVENDLMDYIELNISLAELRESNMLRKLPSEIGELFAPSSSGRETLRLFETRIPHSRREKIDALADAWRERFRREKSVLADWQEDDTGFTVRLRIMEHALTLFDLQINVPSRTQAQEFCQRWNECADDVYGMMLRTLGEAKEKAPDKEEADTDDDHA